MTEIYERNLNVSVSKLDDTAILTKASLLDLNHNIRVELTVDISHENDHEGRRPDGEIPFGVCQHALNKIRYVGLKIERGSTSAWWTRWDIPTAAPTRRSGHGGGQAQRERPPGFTCSTRNGASGNCPTRNSSRRSSCS